jgi:hypothetical protein
MGRWSSTGPTKRGLTPRWVATVVPATLGALVLGLAAGGCPSFSALQLPSTVPEGQLRMAVLVGGGGALSGAMRPEDGPAPSAAQFEFSARYGLSSSVDVGAKLYLIGGEVGVKWQPVRGRLDFAVAPAVSYAAFNLDPGTSVNSLYVHLPLLFGWNVSDVVTLAFGPKLFFGKQFRTATPTRPELMIVDGFLAGLFVAVPVRVTRRFWIAPEVNAYASVGRGEFGATTIYTGGVGFLFGEDDRPAVPPQEPVAPAESPVRPPPRGAVEADGEPTPSAQTGV